LDAEVDLGRILPRHDGALAGFQDLESHLDAGREAVARASPRMRDQRAAAAIGGLRRARQTLDLAIDALFRNHHGGPELDRIKRRAAAVEEQDLISRHWRPPRNA
jgi:hypothetical protein